MSDVILAADGVSKQFGKFLALKKVSVSFQRGRLTAIIGPNGAGKSTFFNLLSGAFPPTFGTVTYEGRDITGLPQHEFARIGIAKSFQITSLFPALSARENVRIALQAMHSRYDLWTARHKIRELYDRADELMALVGLERHGERMVGNLAHGEQRALEIAVALSCQPKLLLLDEPTAGMSPEETRQMMDLIARLAEDRTVVLVEHKMKLVMGICDHLVVLHHGELLAEGTPAEIQTNEEVKRVYLGQGRKHAQH